MILGSLVAPVVAWRAFPVAGDRPFAITALVIGCIDLALMAIALVASFLQ